MNIFYLDSDPIKAAQYQANCHTCKMQTEGMQILSTVMIKHGYNAPMKSSHPFHPSTIWVSESVDNFQWLIEHVEALCKEYTYRYGKRHKVEEYLSKVKIPKLRKIGFTEPPQVVSEEFKGDNTIIAYRKYYVYDKLSQKGWRWEYKNRKEPEWIKDYR